MTERPPAPAPLALVQDFVNSFDVEDAIDELASPADLAAWCIGHDLAAPGTRATRADLERAKRVREAIRALLLANNGVALDPAAIDTLNDAAGHLRLEPRFDPSGHVELAGGGAGIDAALGTIVAVVLGAMADDTWSRLKVCREDSCQWAFYDHSRNRSGQWCVMAVCGNRNKARTFRNRRKEDA